MPTWTERRFDRSSVLSEALDKLLGKAAREHELLSAVVADSKGLLVASAKDDAEAERVAGVVGLIITLREGLEKHQVLEGLSHSVLSAPGDQHLVAWNFEYRNEPMTLALLAKGKLPSQEIGDQIIEGVIRIFSSLKG